MPERIEMLYLSVTQYDEGAPCDSVLWPSMDGGELLDDIFLDPDEGWLLSKKAVTRWTGKPDYSDVIAGVPFYHIGGISLLPGPLSEWLFDDYTLADVFDSISQQLLTLIRHHIPADAVNVPLILLMRRDTTVSDHVQWQILGTLDLTISPTNTPLTTVYRMEAL